MSIANDNQPSIRSIDLSLESATGPDPIIDAAVCGFFFWAGVTHGQADLDHPVEAEFGGAEGPVLKFMRRDGPFRASVPLPNITGSTDEAIALVRAFAPHMEWGLIGYSASSDYSPHAFIAPDASAPDVGAGAVSKYGATHAIALLRALLHTLGRDGMILALDDDGLAR